MWWGIPAPRFVLVIHKVAMLVLTYSPFAVRWKRMFRKILDFATFSFRL
jgi:hypothetical protein